MFVPIPALVVIGLIFVLLIAWGLRASRSRDPLMGTIARRERPAGTVREAPAIAPATVLTPDLEAQLRTLLAAGRKIEAIKVARDATHLSLKEAKELVEGLE